MGIAVGVLLALLSLGQEGGARPAPPNEPAATSGSEPRPAPAPSALAPEPAPSAGGTADPLALRPRKVTDLRGVEQLSLLDVELRRPYDRLASRRAAARLAFGGAVAGSFAAGVLVLVESFKAGFGDLACAPVNTTTGLTCRSASPSYAPALITLGVSAVLAGVGLALLPRDPDVGGVVTLWNHRHPDAPVEGPTPAVATASSSPAAAPSDGVYTPPGW